MAILKATVSGGRLDLEVPADWPDGTQVEIHPLGTDDSNGATLSPDAIAHLLSAMDQLEPLQLTEAEHAAWEAQRLARKESEKSQFPEHAAKLKGMWE